VGGGMRKWGWLNVGGFPSEPPRNGPWVGFDHPQNYVFFFFFLKKKKKKRSFFRDILEGFSLKNSHAILVKNDKLK
jgi:hypothetical protein